MTTLRPPSRYRRRICGAIIALGVLLAPAPGPASAQPPPDLVPALYGSITASTAALDEIPEDLLVLYRQAGTESDCGLPWPVLAGVADVASDHGRVGNSERQTDGTLYPAIIGAALDGQQGRRHIVDTDDGLWDDDSTWDRAVGLFQFIPATWRVYASDGNGDGVRDPQNIWDQAMATAAHLCAEGGAEPATLGQAIASYYASIAFVDPVLSAALRYAEPIAPSTARPDELVVAVETDDNVLELVSDQAQPQAVIVAGTAGDQPVLGDWSADGTDEPGVYRWLDGSQALVFGPGDSDAELLVVGQPGDLILVGDWDGDGRDDPAVFRSFDGRGRFLAFERDGTARGAVDFGRLGDQPLAGDWDGDGRDEPAVYRTSTDLSSGWFFRSDPDGNLLGRPLAAGEVGDLATVGDWDGDGVDSLGLLSPATIAGQPATWTTYDPAGEIVSGPTPLAVDGRPLAGRPAPPPPPIPIVAPEGTEDLAARPGVEFFRIGSGPDDVGLRLWRVNGIVIEEGIAANLSAMVDAAAADGIDLTAWGWRSTEQQVALRQQNCSDVYQTAPSSCRPPTAIPGTSRHEFGRAIDVHVDGRAITAASPVFDWLSENAATYGFFNLPSEPWHWSDSGG